MNRMLSAAFAVLFFLAAITAKAHAAPQATDSLGGSRTTALSHVEDSTNATVTLVSAVSGRSITLYRLLVSVSSADNFHLKCGATQKTAAVYLSGSSGLDTTYYPMYIRCASGEALSLVKGTATTSVGVTLWFTQEP